MGAFFLISELSNLSIKRPNYYYNMLKSITYLSTACVPMNALELEKILKSSLKNNALFGITGMLIYYDRTFIQVIEGPEKAVDQLFLEIKRDNRHENIVVLDDSRIEKREFGNWEMGFRNLDKSEEVGEFSSLKDLGIALKGPSTSNAKTILKTFYDLNISEGEEHSKLII